MLRIHLRLLIPFFSLAAAFPAHSEIVLISEHPIPIKGIYQPLESKTDFLTSLGPENAFIGHFIEQISQLLESFPCPIACWADPSTAVLKEVDVGFGTWNQVLESLIPAIGPVRKIQHPNFVELVWAEPAREVEIRGFLNETVPPFVFLANEPTEFLSMWNILSGMDFKYDSKFIERSKALLKEDPTEGESIFPGREDERHLNPRAIFTSKDSIPVSKFMVLLASQFGGSAWQEDQTWIIGEFKKGVEETAIIRDLLTKIKTNPYNHGYGEAETTLKEIGLPALPEILKEFEEAESYYYNALVNILATMDTSERDQAFLRELREYFKRENKFMDHWYVSTMVQALANNGNREALPIIRDLAHGEGEIRSHSVVALNLLHAPLPPRDVDKLLRIDASVESIIEEEEIRKYIPILYATLDQCFLDGGVEPITLDRIEVGAKRELEPIQIGSTKVVGVAFGGNHRESNLRWEILVGTSKDSKSTVFATWIGAAGYQGEAEFRSGRWLFTKWWQVWVS